MAYESGGIGRFFNPDLSTRLGAQSAMDSAKFCFLLVAGFRVVVYGIAALGSGFRFDSNVPTGVAAMVAVVALEIGLPLVAAWRLHVYKGAFVTPIATLAYVLGHLLALSPAGLVIGALFTAVFVGGIRGAWALRRRTDFEDDYAATFTSVCERSLRRIIAPPS